MKTQIVAFLLLAPLVLSCAGPRLRVQSDPPNAQVFLTQQGSIEKKMVGTTPFELSYKELYEKTGATQGGGEFLTLSFEGKDIETERLLVPTASFGARVVNVRAKLTLKNETKNASMILTRLHNAQKFAQAGDIERAQIEADKALEIDAQFVRTLSMKGSLCYLQKQYDQALQWFEKALAIDNSFDEAVKMIARIKQERK